MNLNEISYKRIEDIIKKIFINCSKDNKAVMNFIKEILWFDRTYYENVRLSDKDFELNLQNNLNLDSSISFTPIIISFETLTKNIGKNKDFIFSYLFINPNISDTFKIKLYQRIESTLKMNNNEFYFVPVFFNDLSFERNIKIIMDRNNSNQIIDEEGFLNHNLLFNTIETINIIENTPNISLFAIKNEIFNFDILRKDLFLLNLYLENLETMDENNEIMFLRIIKNIEFIFVDSGELKEYKNDSFYKESLFKELNSFINKLSKKMTTEVQNSLFFFFSLIEKNKNNFNIDNNDLLFNLSPSFNSFISFYKSNGKEDIEFKKSLLFLSEYFNKNTLITLVNSSESIYEIILDIINNSVSNIDSSSKNLLFGFSNSIKKLKNKDTEILEQLTNVNNFYRELNKIDFSIFESFKGINTLTELLIHNEIYNLRNNNNSIDIKKLLKLIKGFNLDINSREYSLLFLFTNSDFIFSSDHPVSKMSEEISYLTNITIDLKNILKELKDYLNEGNPKVADTNKIIHLKTILNVFLTSPKLLENLYIKIPTGPNEINKVFALFENEILSNKNLNSFLLPKEISFDIDLLTSKKELELQKIIENKDTDKIFLESLLINYTRLISYNQDIISVPEFIKNIKINNIRNMVIHNLSEYNSINDINFNIKEGNILTEKTMLNDIEIDKIIKEHIYNVAKIVEITLNERELTDLVKTIKKETKFNLNF